MTDTTTLERTAESATTILDLRTVDPADDGLLAGALAALPRP